MSNPCRDWYVFFEKPKGVILDCGYRFNIEESDIDAFLGGIEMMDKEKNIFPFVNDPANKEDLSLYLGLKILYKVSSNMKLKPFEEKFLNEDSYFFREGIVKRGGWIFDFRPYLSTFWVKINDEILEYKAIKIKQLRAYLKNVNYGKIQKIVMTEGAQK